MAMHYPMLDLLGHGVHIDVPCCMGIDAQPRGIAVGIIEFSSGKVLEAFWLENTLSAKYDHAKSVYRTYELVHQIASLHTIMVAGVELPMAQISSSSYQVWGCYGAAVSALFPLCEHCESMGVSTWKSSSGLNLWWKGQKVGNKGICPKDKIQMGVEALFVSPGRIRSPNLPKDVYDSIAIARAVWQRNQDLFEDCTKE